MTKRTTEKLRWWLIQSQRVFIVAVFFRFISRLVLWMACRRLLKIRGVTAVYARHTHPASSTFITGQSDVDLTVILDDAFAGDYRCTRECSNVLAKLGDRYLFTKAEDGRFMSEGELSRLTKDFASPLELLCVPEDWLLLGGREVRREKSKPFPANLIPQHPEFNRWWQNVVQEQFFGFDSGAAKGYMRSVYRSAIKNQVHLEAAKGIAARKAEGFVSDDLECLTFDGSSGLLKVLQIIKQRNLWADQPEQKKGEIFLEVLRSTQNFFVNCGPVSSGIRPNLVSHAASTEPHDSVHRAVSDKIAATPELKEALASAVVYPLPHAYPCVYRLDLILPPNIQLQSFLKACSALRLFGTGKSFALAGAPVEFTLIPWSVYQDPRYFLGSDCPFLLEHIKEFGSVVHGKECPYPASEWTASSLVDWCRIYLPFHMVTFRRRLDYGSPVLNFYQLASLMIFLETGSKLTDPITIRQRYEAEFTTSGRDREVADFLFRYPSDRAQPELYDEALARVSDTYDRLESLLAGPSRSALFGLDCKPCG
jgi:hypothetical protein